MRVAILCAGNKDNSAASPLKTLDERLSAYRLGEAERAILISERRSTANAAAKGPYRRATSRGFITDTATLTGFSKSTIYRALKRFDSLGRELLERVKGTSLDAGAELDALIALSAKRRIELVERAAAGEQVTAKFKRG